MRNFLIVILIIFFSLFIFKDYTGFFYFLDSKTPRFERISKKIFYNVQALLPLVLERDMNIKLNVPLHKQEHSLSCEIAVLKMVLNYYGIGVEEEDLLKDLPFDTQKPRGKDNIWGDPNIGFVGDIDGKMPNTGYGVYEKPIADLASKYREAKILENADLPDILEEVSGGKPVIVWGTLDSRPRDISWRTKEGKNIKTVFGEHTRVIIGFSGTISDPKNILLLDPIYGKIKMSKNKFLADWAFLDNKAVVVY